MSSEVIEKLLELAKFYLSLEKGSQIENHTELIEIFNILDSKNDKHPHEKMKVCISRKSLKHFIERRKEDFSKYHSEEQLKEIINFIINNINEIIINFDSYEYKPPKDHYYKKDYSHLGKSWLVILLEEKNNCLEIKSIHIKKNKKKNK
ncbi:MAG: hypothetical protein NTV03_02770 [Candidatus Nomurabacteria bacterium]|nr:hypothetical protein [Candidatus Nomurabacteria bacterium]